MNINDLPDSTSVAVIGAGPSGALSALLLARRGVEVALFDKAEFPRQKVCGCCLSATALQVLHDVGLGDLPKRLNAVPLDDLRLQTASKRLSFPLVDSVSVSRTAFDTALIDEATRAGVKFFPSTAAAVESVSRYSVAIKLRGELDYNCKIALVADGLGGTALKHLSEFSDTFVSSSKLGVAAISHAKSVIEQNNIYMFYDDAGYVGMVKLEDGTTDIAAAIDPTFLRFHHDPATAVHAILRNTSAPIPDDLFDLDWRGTVPLTRSRKAIAGNRIFVIGDSASYVEPFTGEGIAWGLKAAMLVAPLAERASTIWHNSFASEWTNIYMREIRARQRKTAAIAWLLRNPQLAGIGADVLDALPQLRKPLADFIARPKQELHQCPQ